LRNLGLHEDSKICVNKPLVAFYGDIKQGKTTILNAVKLAFGGGFPSDIIKRGEEEASIFLSFENNTTITRSFYRNKQGDTTSRPISFVQEGRVVKNPVKQLQNLINPFILDNEFFMKKTPLERQKYLIELFGVDTSEEDAEIKTLESTCKAQRVEIKTFGEIDTTPVEKPDTEALYAKRNEIQKVAAQAVEAHGKAMQARNAVQNEILKAKANAEDNYKSAKHVEEEILQLQAKIVELEAKRDGFYAVYKSIEIPELPPEPPAPNVPSTAEIDEKIANSKADELKYDLYQEALKKQEKKDLVQKQLQVNEGSLKEKRQEKLDKLIDLSEKTGIEGLEFKEGGFMYKDVDDGMLSTSDILELSNGLAALYNDGLKLKLVDRGESLGKSINDLARHAEEDERTVLVTVVGDAPADIPSNIGVFLVEDGKVVKQ